MKGTKDSKRKVGKMSNEFCEVEEGNLTFKGSYPNAKDLAEELREVYSDAGRDMDNDLSDFIVQLETAYQTYYELDKDDWGREKGDNPPR